MPSALVAVPESPSPPRHCRRLRSPLSIGGAAGDFELRHWRTPKRRAQASVPPEIEITNDNEGGSGHRYTSLRDILSSPEYAAGSPAACFGGGGGCGDIHMIRHPLVKHAAFAYLQMTPSAREDPGRRRRRWRGPLCRLLLGCLSFIGALFRP